MFCLFLTEKWAGLKSVIMAFSGQTHFLENVQAGKHLGITITNNME